MMDYALLEGSVGNSKNSVVRIIGASDASIKDGTPIKSPEDQRTKLFF
jgi:hypothetical protein